MRVEQSKFTIKKIIEELEKRPTFYQKKKFLKEHNFKIYQGYSRAVIQVSKHKVLKIAKDNEDVFQNRQEVENWVYGTKKQRKYLATIYSYDNNYKWLLMEKVKPCKRSTSEKLIRENNNLHNIFWHELDADPWETVRQCGFNKRGKLKVYDYGY